MSTKDIPVTEAVRGAVRAGFRGHGQPPDAMADLFGLNALAHWAKEEHAEVVGAIRAGSASPLTVSELQARVAALLSGVEALAAVVATAVAARERGAASSRAGLAVVFAECEGLAQAAAACRDEALLVDAPPSVMRELGDLVGVARRSTEAAMLHVAWHSKDRHCGALAIYDRADAGLFRCEVQRCVTTLIGVECAIRAAAE